MAERYVGKAAFEHFSTLLPNIWNVLRSCVIVTKVSSIWNDFKIQFKKPMRRWHAAVSFAKNLKAEAKAMKT